MQSVTNPTRAKRASAGVAAACAVALTGGAMAAGPANAAPADDGARASKTLSAKNLKYKCKATNSVVDQIVGGPQQFKADAKGTFKGSFKPGSTITSGKQRITLILPKKLVRKVRKDLSVKRVRGSANLKYDYKAKPGGVTRVPVKGLRSGWKRVPRKGAMRIPVVGKANAYQIKKGTKSVKLLAPKRFKIHARLAPPVLGSVKKTDLNCKFNGKTRAVGTLMR